MTGTWLTLNEIAALLSREKCSIVRKANKGHWPYRSYAGRGGQERRYHLAALPEKIRAAYAASLNGLNAGLPELQARLKPVLTREKKASIARYNGRGAKAGNVKSKERIPEKYLETANARLGVPQTPGASGLSARAFITAYQAGVIAREFRERPGPRGEIKSFQSLCRWLGRYEQYGIEGLAPQYGGKGGAGASLTEEEKARIEWLYLTQNKPAAASGIENIKQYGIELNPSAVYRYIKRIPRAVKDSYGTAKNIFTIKTKRIWSGITRC